MTTEEFHKQRRMFVIMQGGSVLIAPRDLGGTHDELKVLNM